MSHRRHHTSFRLTKTAEATGRIYPDVIVQPHGSDEWIAIGRQPALPGETLLLDIVLLDTDGSELRHRLPVCVIDSYPIIRDGDMRHRIRLHAVPVADWPGADGSSCPDQTSRR